MMILLLLGSSACSQSAQAIVDVDALAERAGKAVWQVEAVGCGWKTRGSAFAIDARHLVTNRHVIANDSSPTIRSRDGRERQGKVIGASTHPDVAVIEVGEDLADQLAWAPTSSLANQEPLVVIGYPSPAFAFKVSTGQIVNFQGPNGTREAALANAPIDHGNSGGPGLRGDASVAGLVTQMVIRAKPEDRVAILFTAEAVHPTVAKFINAPSKVLSFCGLGPDYVPPVPKSYEIKEAPRTAAPIAALPLPSGAKSGPVAALSPRLPVERTKNIPPTATPPCPEGAPAVEVSELKASEVPDDPGRWTVDARGLVRNDMSSSIYVRRVEVRVDGEPPLIGSVAQDVRYLGVGA